MFKQDLISQIINQTDHYPEEKDKKIILFMEGELGGKIITGFASFRSKIYSYLINDRDGNKKAKRTRWCVIKGKLKFEDYTIFLEAYQLENEISHLGKINFEVDSLRENHKERLRDKGLILKH